MTRKQRAIVTTWTAVLISAIAVMISSLGVGYVAIKNSHDASCNKAWIEQFNDAQSARAPFADKQNAALISAFRLLALPPGSKPPKDQISDLRHKGAAFVGSGTAYEAAKANHPYPTNTCPGGPKAVGQP